MRTFHVVVAVRGRDVRSAGRAIQRRLKGAPAHREASVIRVQDEDGNVVWRPSDDTVQKSPTKENPVREEA